MADPVLAWIVPMSAGTPTHPIAPGGPIPPVDPGYGMPNLPGMPAHPIAPGGPPGVPTHPIARPPPGIWPGPGHPAHPIAMPEPPTDPGYGVSGDRPAHLPAGSVLILVWIPGKGLEWIVVDANLKPEHPIELPPEPPPQVAHPIAPGGEAPAHPIQPTPAPKK